MTDLTQQPTSGEELGAAIDRALAAAGVRADGAGATSWTSTMASDLGAVESGDALGGMDAD